MPVIDGIYFSISGRGSNRFPPVLLIHGAGGTHLSWTAEMRRLMGFQVIAVDLPGHGRSEGTGLQSVEAYAYRLIGLLENLKIHRVILVGHSMGGAIALTTAIRRPMLVAGLGLISTGAFLGGESEVLEYLSSQFGFSRALQMIKEKAFGAQTNPGLIKNVMQALGKTRYGVLYGDWLACANFDIRSDVNMIHAPAWVATGEDDRLIPLAYSRFLIHNLKNTSFQIISGAGHMVVQEAGAELALGLRAFLERIDFQDQLWQYQDAVKRNQYHNRDTEGY